VLLLAAATLLMFALVPGDLYLDSPKLLGSEQALFCPGSAFHDTAIVTTAPAKAVVRLFRSGVPPIIAGNTTTYRAKYGPDRTEAGYWATHSFFLAPGSVVRFNVTAGSTAAPAALYVIRSHREYSRYCSSMRSWRHVYSAHGTAFAASLAIDVHDEYFWVLEAHALATVSWSFELEKTFFDVSGAAESCAGQPVCVMPVAAGDCVLVEVPGHAGLATVVDMNASAPAVTSLYWSAFGPLVGCAAGLVLALAVFLVLRRRRQLERRRSLLPSDATPTSTSIDDT
jgi:hypothetical protein